MIEHLSNNVIVDVDDVVANFVGELLPVMNELTGKNVQFEEWTSFNFLQHYSEMSYQDIQDIIVEHELYERALPIYSALAGIQKLIDCGYRIHFVTARGQIKNAQMTTEMWMLKHNVEYHTLSVVPHGESKAEAYRKIADHFAFIIDDNVDNLDDAIASGLVEHCVVINKPWNAHRTDFNRFDCLGHFVDHILP